MVALEKVNSISRIDGVTLNLSRHLRSAINKGNPKSLYVELTESTQIYRLAIAGDTYLTLFIYFCYQQRWRGSMTRSNLLFAISAFFLSYSQVCAEPANGPIGIWLTQAGDAKVRINHCGVGLCGTIVWLKDPIDRATGKPQVDDKNTNQSLARRPIIGINIFKGMKSVTNNKWKLELDCGG